MKLSTRASSSFLCVCSLERNAGKVYTPQFFKYTKFIKHIETSNTFTIFFREVVIDHLHLPNTPEKRNLIKSFWRLKRQKVGYRTPSKHAQATQSSRLSRSPLLRSDHRLLLYFLFLDAFPLKFIFSKYLHSPRYLLSSVQISWLLYLYHSSG